MALTFFIKRTETVPQLQATLINVDGDYNPLSNVTSVLFTVLSKTRPIIQKPAVILDIPTKKVGYTWTTEDLILLIPGIYTCFFYVTYVDNSFKTFPNDGSLVTIQVTL
jgi:hypothetical protein